MSANPEVIVLGGGLTGLACAYHLEQAGYSSLLLDRSDAVGGRLRTDRYRGFLLDRGFRVILSSAPEIWQVFRKSELPLHHFLSAAKLRFEGEWYELRNPMRHPFSTLGTARFPRAMWPDLLRLIRLYFHSRQGQLNSFATIHEVLDYYHISEHFRDVFLRPLLGSLLLDLDFRSPPHLFSRLLYCLASGYASLPEGGIETVPSTLAKKLKRTEIRLGCEVEAIEGNTLYLQGGEKLHARAVVVAVERPAAAKLLGLEVEAPSLAATNLYFRIPADRVPASALLYFDGSREGPINQLAFLNQIEPSYAPMGQMLASVTVVDPQWIQEPNLIDKVRQQLAAWFHTRYTDWGHLRNYELSHVLPKQDSPPPFANCLQDPNCSSLFYAGELSSESTVAGSLKNGRQVAEAVIRHLTS